jgi:hypothetical protein
LRLTENKELRKKLVERTVETSTSQSFEGNENWLKRQLREVKDTIIWLREAQRMLEEKIAEHFKECELTMENLCTTLASAQSKLKGNEVL